MAMRASRSRTRGATNLLTSTSDDATLAIACALLTARDLLCLRLSCRRFNIRCITSGSGGAAAAAAEKLCIVEVAARRWLAECSEQERGWVPRLELGSWVCLMHEVELLRVPVVFGRSHAEVTLSEGGTVATKNGNGIRTAASTVVMRSGRHFVQFTVLEGADLLFGVIRPGCDVEGGATAHTVYGHCFYATFESRYPGNSNWEGMQTAREQGDLIGMLLDLDQGSMTVWKNGEKLGVMLAGGLSGPLCWAVSLFGESEVGDSARIESALAPASPTEEELAAAAAWQED